MVRNEQVAKGDGHKMNQDEDTDWLMGMKAVTQKPFTIDNSYQEICFTASASVTLT